MKKFLSGCLLALLTTSAWAIMPSALLDSSDGAKSVEKHSDKAAISENEAVALEDIDLQKKIEKLPAVAKDPKKWALIIAADHYDETDNVKYSKESGLLFKEVAQKLLGVTERRTYALIGKDATTGKIKNRISKLLKFVRSGDTIYFYYSGHGIPDIDTKEPYLLPKDLDPSFVTDEPNLKLQNIYRRLSASRASKVIALVDSCFSGATDNHTLFTGVAAPRIKAKKVLVDKNKMVVITAGQDKQFSNMYKDKKMRLFSYYLIDNIIKGHKDIKTLFKDLKNSVEVKSFEFGDQYYQSPTLTGKADMSL